MAWSIASLFFLLNSHYFCPVCPSLSWVKSNLHHSEQRKKLLMIFSTLISLILMIISRLFRLFLTLLPFSLEAYKWPQSINLQSEPEVALSISGFQLHCSFWKHCLYLVLKDIYYSWLIAIGGKNVFFCLRLLIAIGSHLFIKNYVLFQRYWMMCYIKAYLDSLYLSFKAFIKCYSVHKQLIELPFYYINYYTMSKVLKVYFIRLWLLFFKSFP